MIWNGAAGQGGVSRFSAGWRKALLFLLPLVTLWLPAAEQPLPLPLQGTRFIGYTPRSFAVSEGRITPATPEGIRADLRLLRSRFDGLVTYSADNGLELVPALAHELGFRAVIIGIWDPRSQGELDNAIAAAGKFPDTVAAVVVGNEGLYTGRYRREDVERAVRRINRVCPSLAVTTSEPFSLYFKREYHDFFAGHDLLMPNVHPVFEPWFDPGDPGRGVEMVVKVAARFQSEYRLPLLIKETGLPSGPSGMRGYSQERQALFWKELHGRLPASAGRCCVFFEAFDAPWKPAAMAVDFPGDRALEAYWGFFDSRGAAKRVVAILPPLSFRN